MNQLLNNDGGFAFLDRNQSEYMSHLNDCRDFGFGNARSSTSFQTRRHVRSNRRNSCDHAVYVPKTSERSCAQQSPKRDTINPSKPGQHHKHHDYEGCQINNDAYHLTNRTYYDDDFHFKPYLCSDDSRPNDQKSLISGHTTVEPESCVTESTHFEYPEFPSELKEDSYNSRQNCDFEDSLHAVLAVSPDRSNDVRRTKCFDELDHDDEYMGVFQIFQNENMHRVNSHCGYEDGHDEDTLRGQERELSDATGSRNRGTLYDDGLLVAFEEMQQL